MRAVAYFGRFRDQEIRLSVTNKNISEGFCKITCFDCDGSGRYLKPDDVEITCGVCKGNGNILINT